MSTNGAVDVVDQNAASASDSPGPPKPLKSILKKRKPESSPSEKEDTKTEDDGGQPDVKKPKGGSITQALKMLTSFSHGSEGEDDESDPKPSAFILEMEKQKAQLPVIAPGALSFPSRVEGFDVDMDIDGNDSSAKNSQQPIDPPPGTEVDQEIKITEGPLTMMTPHEDVIEGIIAISNLPYKVTVKELVIMLGVWPKGGHNGVRLITDSSALPAGYAYVIVERHTDMMDILRLTGVEFQGRKLRCTKSSRENLIRDWKITKQALVAMDKSRVVKVTQLPFVLKKSELIKSIKEVDFTEDVIYWSPLKEHQTNSGRGFIILSSSEDAKKIAEVGKYRCLGRTIQVTQCHPNDLKNFCRQCRLDLDENLTLQEELGDDAYDISDLNLAEKPDSLNPLNSTDLINSDGDTKNANSRTASSTSSSQKKTSHSKRSEQNKSKLENRRNAPQGSSHPPFKPSIFVRMHNVPDKATTSDIRRFFEPILPAKIAQNIGYNIWDIEFHNPEDAMTGLQRHNLMMRKNVIYLEMLPGPPHPLPPRPAPPFQPNAPIFPMPLPYGPFPAAPYMMYPHPPGVPYDHPRMMMPPDMARDLPPSGPPDMRPPSVHPHYHGHHPIWTPHGPGAFPPERTVAPDPRTMPAPMSRADIGPRKDNREKSSRSKTKLDKSRKLSPEPKKELIPVPPLPEDFSKYTLPSYNGDIPVGQGLITTMQGYFCQLCNKFYSSRNSATDSHCKSKGHYDKLKLLLQEKKRIRRLAEAENSAEG